MIRKKLFHGCTEQPGDGVAADGGHGRIERPDVRIELVHEPPDDAGRDEADGERQEDDRLDHALVANPVDEDGDQQAEPDRRAAAAGPPTGRCSGARSSVSLLAEEPLVVLEPDERVAAPVLEAPDDRRDRRVDEEDAEERRAPARATATAAGRAAQRRGDVPQDRLDEQDVADQDDRDDDRRRALRPRARFEKSASSTSIPPPGVGGGRPARPAATGSRLLACRRPPATVSRLARMESRSPGFWTYSTMAWKNALFIAFGMRSDAVEPERLGVGQDLAPTPWTPRPDRSRAGRSCWPR